MTIIQSIIEHIHLVGGVHWINRNVTPPRVSNNPWTKAGILFIYTDEGRVMLGVESFEGRSLLEINNYADENGAVWPVVNLAGLGMHYFASLEYSDGGTGNRRGENSHERTRFDMRNIDQKARDAERQRLIMNTQFVIDYQGGMWMDVTNDRGFTSENFITEFALTHYKGGLALVTIRQNDDRTAKYIEYIPLPPVQNQDHRQTVRASINVSGQPHTWPQTWVPDGRRCDPRWVDVAVDKPVYYYTQDRNWEFIPAKDA